MNNELRAIMSESKKPYPHPQLPRIGGDMLELSMEWESEMKRRGATGLSNTDSAFVYFTFESMRRPDVQDRPTLVAAPPGFGKSLMLSIYLRHMVRKEPDTFGAIVIKERLEDMRALVDYINLDDLDDADGLTRRHNYAYFIEGFDERKHTREHYEQQFTTQANYNVLVMTKKMFEIQVLKGNLETYTSFYDASGNKRPRRTLLIDEKPSLTVPYTLTSRELNGLVDDIRSASYKSSAKIKRYYSRALELIKTLRTQIESPEIEMKHRLEPVDRKYLLPRDLIRNFCETHELTKLTKLRAFEYIVRHGGLISFDGRVVQVLATHKVYYEWGLYNSFVFDGSGAMDPEYACDDFYVLEPPSKPDYTNVTFHICGDFSLSRSAIRGDIKSLDKIADECRVISKRHGGVSLVVTYNECKEELGKRLEDEIESGEIRLKHFDGGRGSNHYVAADTAVYIGSLHKGSLYYPSTARAAVGHRIERELSAKFTVNKRTGLVFEDPIVEEYRKLDMAVNLVQETNRLRANQKQQEVNIYVFIKDEDVSKYLTDTYPGCKIKTYIPGNKLTGATTAADGIISFFRNMQEGERVKQSMIYKSLDMPRDTFKSAVKKGIVVEAMNRLGIERDKTFYVKR